MGPYLLIKYVQIPTAVRLDSFRNFDRSLRQGGEGKFVNATSPRHRSNKFGSAPCLSKTFANSIRCKMAYGYHKIIAFMIVRHFILFLFLFLIHPAQGQESHVSPKIKSYVDFIDNRHTSAADYVLHLFERYDIVILGERDHRDTTQYDLIEQIVSDPRFIDKVGHVMTEIGVYNMTDEIDRIVNSSYASDKAFEAALWSAYKNLDYTPLWENTNFYQYLCSIYRINRNLPASRKIHISLLDMPFSWRQAEGMTHEQFHTVLQMWEQKDLIMANNTLTELYKLFEGTDTRKKALIILNAPHSYAVDHGKRNSRYAGQMIMERFPERVANILLNRTKKGSDELTQNGKWDAAFAACGNKSIGFDLAGTPFGEDCFDLNPRCFNGKYKEIYHGFIFYKPVEEWVFGLGIPNPSDSDFEEELAGRDSSVWEGTPANSPEEIAEINDYYTKIKCLRIDAVSLKKINRQIGKYYQPGIRQGITE